MIKYFVIMLIFSCYTASSQNIWDEVFYKFNELPESIECPDSNNFYVVTHNTLDEDPIKIFKTSDQGKNWVLHSSIFLNNHWIETNSSFSCPDSNNFFLVLRTGQKNSIYISNNSGLSFEKRALDDIDYFRASISMYNENIGIVSNGQFITRNGWKSFDNLNEMPYGNAYSPRFINDSICIMAFSELKLNQKYFLKININTLKFELHLIDKPFTINDFCYFSDSLMFICGKSDNISGGSGHDAIYKSTDGGKNWRRVLNLSTTVAKHFYNNPFGLQSIAFKDSLTGICVGQFGKILYTYDGGESWQYENKLPPQLGGGESSPPTMIVRYAGSMPIIAAYNGYIHRLKEDNLAPGPEHIYTISGRVWEGEKGQPGIPVSIGFRVTMTDSLGYYKFTKVKAGNYILRALNKHYDGVNQTYFYKPFDYEPLQYDIELTGDTSSFDFNAIDLRTFYSASGYVLDTEGKGIADITFKVADSTAVSESSGKFHFPRIESRRQYDLTPITEGYSYSPAYHTINLITGDTTDLKFTGTSTTSVWESGEDRGIRINPNPARDYIVIALDRWTPLSKWRPSVQVQIFDMLGIEVGQSFLIVNDSNNNSQSGMIDLLKIDVSHLPAGVYFIRIGNKVEKFVKM
ncbi:MAG: T9SS type A sorting domain-containing protein [Candidatus Kapabacteria bacterium]|nr:T9SS type A sorting domain-containing protein [Ignavibacteriota bacterium]MCW5886208.1 T9SS type A sorting domain-containing protein [Candidatus Kapabacteria bacterium]